jgi:hypothetical protein
VFERFTDRARRVLVLAQEEARLLGHTFIGTEHLLLGLIHEGDGVAAKALESLGISLEAVRAKVEETIGPAGSITNDSPPFTPRAKKVLELSLREALQLGHNYIGTEHILLGLIREGEGVATQVLIGLGADLSRVRQQVIQLLSGYTGGPGDILRPDVAGPVSLRAPGDSGPHCPSCRVNLETHIAYRLVTVPSDRPDLGVGPLEVVFVYCRRCGFTISHGPAATFTQGPGRQGWVARRRPGRSRSSSEASILTAAGGDEPRRSTQESILRGPPPAEHEFPEELWNATAPEEVPPAAVVDLMHGGRFAKDGTIRGTVSGARVDLAVELPRSASSARGTLGDELVDVMWRLSYDSGGDRELPAALQGTIGSKRVELRGVFRRAPGYWFDQAMLEGTLADAYLTASIERASGGFDSTDTIVATGTLDDRRFEIFAALDGTLEHGRVRGTFDGQNVYLDLIATRGADSHLQGTCPSPAPFALLLVASLFFFA